MKRSLMWRWVAAKFRSKYQGGMPTLGCPGCNGETMEYVYQER